MKTITVNSKNETKVREFLAKENIPFTVKESKETFSGKFDDKLIDFSIENIEQEKLDNLMRLVD